MDIVELRWREERLFIALMAVSFLVQLQLFQQSQNTSRTGSIKVMYRDHWPDTFSSRVMSIHP
jgi:hypothetical protein